MKNLCLPLVIAIIYSNPIPAAVKNGYGLHIYEVRESLKTLQTILDETDTLSAFQKSEIRKKIGTLLEFVAFHQLTELLLSQFRLIAPDLFNKVDTVRSRNGFPITVYVRFVSEEDMQHGAHATTNIAHAMNDPDLYASEFGPATVSVKIASVNRSLLLLAHEFGHVIYQVRNLAAYMAFYTKSYQNETFNSSYIGHDGADPSGMRALEFENIYRNRYYSLVKARGEKVETPFSLLATIRRNVGRTTF
ncbi:MAG TPA: hypothetical protein VF141_02980 [Chryseolinea sp.]